MTTQPPVSEDWLKEEAIRFADPRVYKDQWHSNVGDALRELLSARTTIAALKREKAAAIGLQEGAAQVVRKLEELRDAAVDALTASVEEREKLQREVATVRANDARYRWLKTRFGIMGPQMDGQHPWYLRFGSSLRGPSLDAAIDAQLLKDSKDSP